MALFQGYLPLHCEVRYWKELHLDLSVRSVGARSPWMGLGGIAIPQVLNKKFRGESMYIFLMR
jgi:hypothetical protein